jgi:hypothetical protein
MELYDKGNIVLCNSEYIILTLLRPRSDSDEVRFAVHERYPIELAHTTAAVTEASLETALATAKEGDQLRKLLNPMLACGPSVIEHALLTHGFPSAAAISNGFELVGDSPLGARPPRLHPLRPPSSSCFRGGQRWF